MYIYVYTYVWMNLKFQNNSSNSNSLDQEIGTQITNLSISFRIRITYATFPANCKMLSFSKQGSLPSFHGNLNVDI